jgi:hypothetical protein
LRGCRIDSPGKAIDNDIELGVRDDIGWGEQYMIAA